MLRMEHERLSHNSAHLRLAIGGLALLCARRRRPLRARRRRRCGRARDVARVRARAAAPRHRRPWSSAGAAPRTAPPAFAARVRRQADVPLRRAAPACQLQTFFFLAAETRQKTLKINVEKEIQRVFWRVFQSGKSVPGEAGKKKNIKKKLCSGFCSGFSKVEKVCREKAALARPAGRAKKISESTTSTAGFRKQQKRAGEAYRGARQLGVGAAAGATGSNGGARTGLQLRRCSSGA